VAITHAAAELWLKKYGQAWATRAPQLAAGLATGTRVNLDGVFMLEFSDAGTCSTLREWWHREETPPS
jgi:hypothetical protein